MGAACTQHEPQAAKAEVLSLRQWICLFEIIEEADKSTFSHDFHTRVLYMNWSSIILADGSRIRLFDSAC